MLVLAAAAAAADNDHHTVVSVRGVGRGRVELGLREPKRELERSLEVPPRGGDGIVHVEGLVGRGRGREDLRWGVVDEEPQDVERDVSELEQHT